MKHQSHNSRATNQSSATILCKHCVHTHMILIDVLHVNYYIGFEKKIARIHPVCHLTAEKNKQENCIQN